MNPKNFVCNVTLNSDLSNAINPKILFSGFQIQPLSWKIFLEDENLDFVSLLISFFHIKNTEINWAMCCAVFNTLN